MRPDPACCESPEACSQKEHPASPHPSGKLILLISHREIKLRSAPIAGPFGWDTNSFGNAFIYAQTSFQKTERAAGGCLGTTEPLHEEHASSAHGQGFLRSAFLVTPPSHERDILPAFGEALHDLCPPGKGILGESQEAASKGRALSLLTARGAALAALCRPHLSPAGVPAVLLLSEPAPPGSRFTHASHFCTVPLQT